MTNVGQAATAELLTTTAAPTPGWLGRSLGLTAVALALLSAFVTFVVLAGLTPIPPTHVVVVTLLAVNAGTGLLLTAFIGQEVWGVIQARRRGRAAARLHVRIVGLFSVIAAVPAVLVAIVASVTLDRGLDRLFSQQTYSLIENAVIVADAYVRELDQLVRADSIALAIELARARPLFDQSREQFHQFLSVQASIRGLPALMLLGKDLNVIDQIDVPISQSLAKPTTDVLAGIDDTEPLVKMFLDNNYVAAIIKLHDYSDTYLFIDRVLDPRVLAQ
jgi:two-component system nitrogen regulation sensor histidine kinase NtrY